MTHVSPDGYVPNAARAHPSLISTLGFATPSAALCQRETRQIVTGAGRLGALWAHRRASPRAKSWAINPLGPYEIRPDASLSLLARLEL